MVVNGFGAHSRQEKRETATTSNQLPIYPEAREALDAHLVLERLVALLRAVHLQILTDHPNINGPPTSKEAD